MARSLSSQIVAVTALMSVFLAGRFSIGQDAKPRTWKDATGQFEIEGSFVSEKDGTVTIKQKSGEEVEVALKDLSAADQSFVKTAKANPFQSKPKGSPSPFNTKTPAGGGTTPAPAAVSGGRAPDTRHIDWSQARLLFPPDENQWKEISIKGPSYGKARAASLPKARDFSERFSGMATGKGFAIVASALVDSLNRAGGDSTRLMRIDVESGSLVGTIVVQGAYDLVDVSPTGDQMLVRRHQLGTDAEELEIWKPAGKEVEKLAVLSPFGREEQFRRAVNFAKFTADGRLVVANKQGRAGIVDPQSGDGVCSVTKCDSVALSPDRRYAAIVADNVLIVDLEKGVAVASLKIEQPIGSAAAFSSDGSKLAIVHLGSITVFTLSNGELYRDDKMVGIAAGNQPLLFTSPTHVLVNGMRLIDVENHLPLWQYLGAEGIAQYGDQVLFLSMSGAQPGLLFPSALPHPAAARGLQQALATPNLFAVSPGVSVSVDVSGLPDPNEGADAKAALELALQKSGMKVAPGAPLVLKASMTSAPDEREFRTIGRGAAGNTKITGTKYTSKVELTGNGQSVWESSGVSGIPFTVFSTGGKSLQEAVNEQNKPYYGFFKSVSIPQYIMPKGQETIGRSLVTSQGLN